MEASARLWRRWGPGEGGAWGGEGRREAPSQPHVAGPTSRGRCLGKDVEQAAAQNPWAAGPLHPGQVFPRKSEGRAAGEGRGSHPLTKGGPGALGWAVQV